MSESLSELVAAVDTYEKLVRSEASYKKHAHFDTFEETSLKRSIIHDYIMDFGSSVPQAILSSIVTLDKLWQERVTKEKESDFEIVDINREGFSRSEWWWWIDQLEQLSESEKSTL